MTNYTAFMINDQTKEAILKRFPPQYPRISADHITYEYDVSDFGTLHHPHSVEITAIADDGNGIQALIVSVDGKQYKPDGNPYHITISYDPSKSISKEISKEGLYRPIISNFFIDHILKNKEHRFYHEPVTPPLKIDVSPALVEKRPGEEKKLTYLPHLPNSTWQPKLS